MDRPMTPKPRARKYDPDVDVITRSDTVASPLRASEDAPASGLAWRKPAEPRELQPYTARLTEPELLPTSDDPTVVDKGLARNSLVPPAPKDRVSVTPSRMSFAPSRMSLTPSSLTPSRRLEPTVSLTAPRVPSDRTPHGSLQDPNAAVPPAGRARGVDFGPWLLVLGTTLAAAAIGAVLGYATRPNAGSTPAPAAQVATGQAAPRMTEAPPAERRVPVASPARTEAPAATSTVPVMRLGELPVDAPAAAEASAEQAAPAEPAEATAPARRPPAPHPAARHR